MKKMYVLNTLLTAVVAVALAVIVLMRTFLPQYILPEATIPNLVILSLIALMLDHYIAKGAGRCWICIPVFALITFGVLPWACGYAQADALIELAVTGCIVFTATAWLFTSIQDRLSSGPAAKAAPVISALSLWFAAQCLQGIL
ncbi:MAG: hypothetical protein IKM02_01690 [Clostridia bacterium]|nr:hypothetical protein [Clostridia bacterium]